MSVRTTYRSCSRCGKPIPFNPTAGKFGTCCPRCLASQRADSGNRPSIPHAPRRKP